MVAQVIWPLEVWLSGTNENSLPANDNALRMQAVADGAIGVADSAPVGPGEDDQYIVGTTWGGFTTGNIVIYKGGTWLEFEAFEGQLKTIAGEPSRFDGSAWVEVGGGGGTVESIVPGTGISVNDTDPANPIVSATGGGGGGPAPVEVISGTTYTVTAADAGKYLRFTSGSAKSATVDPESTTPLPDDGEWYFRNHGANDLTLIEGSGVTINPPAGGTLVVPSGGTVALKRVAADEFDLSGQVSP